MDTYEHNYKATMGRDADLTSSRNRARQVTWASDEEEAGDILRVATPTYTTKEQVASMVETSLTHLLEEQVAILRNCLNRNRKRAFSRILTKCRQSKYTGSFPASLWPVTQKCYGCGEIGHFKRECSRSPSPAPKTAGNA